eukprot:CAMPEP_0194519052 /NCGR_PEP_ID=MMETSP0253-20130528/52605_1 /TAXON_ID=2966 /ORGANISM="Noctiluca scintillans" /LENGTH=275 /DNA_ID=CAMNT_0039363141 /DNA_START=326 /DNA_END=1153 /DNA_ORIENTATION=-
MVLHGIMVYVVYVYALQSSVRTNEYYFEKYKEHMVDDDVFNASQFGTLDAKAKLVVCKAPIINLAVLIPVLTIWTLYNMIEFRQTLELLTRVVWSLPTTEMKNMLQRQYPKKEVVFSDREGAECEYDHQLLLVGLHPFVRALLFVCFVLPRGALCVALLYVGCYWLVATIDYGECLINCVALTFILDLKHYLYRSIPSRLQHEALGILIVPHTPYERPNLWRFSYSYSFLIPVVAVVWQSIVQGLSVWDIELSASYSATCSSWLDDTKESMFSVF